ncbi:nicotinate-nucleotide adenylyltransferase [Halobacillus sp. A5]|uniref:nicotinate-nucleotide adenylyltransferase n=1 Tax=Halobacillus sp. A5 TaxID=2880263 RepID=UPI0020A67B20|nr:nicotinate-nucleotide adenylyltransferase [Halobacillus sp. A5]MCP3025610.1 nicotinate-nucleotide adenylyltransferase [Halobacillus sp. A5]
MKVGLLGGTFDPPHLGHLIIAEHVCEMMGLDEIWFIPSHVPPHKQESSISADDRLVMVEKAVESNPHFFVSSIELERKGKSYTLDTIKELDAQFPSYNFCFIIGGDMVDYLDRWYRIEELKRLVQFVGVGRGGSSNAADGVTMVDIPRIDISSSMIRERLSNKQSVRYLVADQVNDYIKENALYAPES